MQLIINLVLFVLIIHSVCGEDRRSSFYPFTCQVVGRSAQTHGKCVWPYNCELILQFLNLPHMPYIFLDFKKIKLQGKYYRVPTAQGKQGKWPKKYLSWKTQGIGNFAKTQGKRKEFCLFNVLIT